MFNLNIITSALHVDTLSVVASELVRKAGAQLEMDTENKINRFISLFLDSQEYLFLPGFIHGFSQYDNSLLFSGLPVTPSITAYLKLLQILIEQLTWLFVLDYKYRLLPPKSEYQQVRRPYPPS